MDQNTVYQQTREVELQSVTIEQEQSRLVNIDEIQLTSQEKKYIVILTTLFFVQGIPLGFVGALSLSLASFHASMSQQAILSLCYLPYSCKLLAAPILDSLYSDRVGKRRSYVLPCQYLLGLSYIMMGFLQFSDLLKELRVGYIAAICCFTIFLSAIQDIAVDGWVLTSLSKKYVHLGSPCQAIGQSLGSMFGSVLMINLTSRKFARQIFIDTDEPFLTLNEYCYMTGFIILAISIIVQIFTSEINPKRVGEISTNSCSLILQVLKDLFQLFYNKNMRILIIFIIMRGLPVAPISASSSFKLIQEGNFPQEILSSLTIILFPFKSFVACIVAKYLPRGKESTWIYISYWLTILDSFFQYLLVTNISQLGGYSNISLWLMIMVSLFSGIVGTFSFCSTGGFFMRISDSNVGGSYLTMLASASNLGDMLSSFVGLQLLEYFPYNQLVMCFWAFGLIFIILIKNSLFELQKADLDSWKVQ